MATLEVEIVSPEAALWSGEAQALIARSSEGDFTIMAQHTPTVGDVLGGLVRVQTAEGETAFVVHSGYFQVVPQGDGVTRATVLASVALNVADVNVAAAQVDKDAAEAAIAVHSKEGGDEGELLVARDALAWAELRLAAK
jgi:F-type H+-transporting ATPase subunit epsilon